MNCSKCGSEMKFVGSISRGKMECPCCDAPDDEGKADNLAKSAPSQRLTAAILGAMQRMREYEDYTQQNRGVCPYCARLAGHFNEVACSASYHSDEAAVTLFQAGSSPTPAPPTARLPVYVGDRISFQGLKRVDASADMANDVYYTTVIMSGYLVTIRQTRQEVLAHKQEGIVVKVMKDGVQP